MRTLEADEDIAGPLLRLDVPRLTVEFLAEHDLDLVAHGDHVGEEAAADGYGPAVESGRLRLVPRSEGVSTTDLIARVPALPK